MLSDCALGVGVDSRARIDPEATIGPYCVIGPDVHIGRGTRLEGHVTVVGRVTIGEHNHIHSGVLIGSLSRRAGSAVIGDHNVLREAVTVRLNGAKQGGPTTIGDHNFLMACTHIGRGCRLEDHIIMANAARLAAEVRVGRHAFLSGGVLVEPRVSIGRHAFISLLSRIRRDAPPFMMIEGKPPRPRCVNLVGLKRQGFSGEAIRALTKAHRLIYRDRLDLSRAFEVLQQAGLMLEPVGDLFDFVQAQRAGARGRALKSNDPLKG
ncbi:MAG TPA: acyl-ACP--UDP-N-acetylglucosamine O-acyltransferase [Pirellulales bacterium]|nr:acyl-ACP--UDP-N-acetylglucosamine O-acyltransferase [Pirellulales bacterium]